MLPRRGTGPTRLCIAASEGHNQFSCSHDSTRVSFPAIHRSKGVRLGKSFSCSLRLLQADTLHGKLSHAHPPPRVSLLALPLPSESALLCCPGEVQGLLFWMLQQVRNRTSSPALMNPWPALLFVIDGRVQGKGISPLLIPPHSKQEAGLAFPHSHSWAGSPQPSHPGPTLLYCPGERQGQ